MATVNEIELAFQICLGAGMNYPPRADEITTRANSWCLLLGDIPGPHLVQAARDIAMNEDVFPSVAHVRKQAAVSGRHNTRRVNILETMPAAYQREHTRLKEKYANEGLPTDDELYRLEQLSGRIEA